MTAVDGLVYPFPKQASARRSTWSGRDAGGQVYPAGRPELSRGGQVYPGRAGLEQIWAGAGVELLSPAGP